MNLPPTKPTPPPPNAATTLKGECSHCGSKERWLFHRMLVRGVDRRLCTSCVLRLNPSCFCPSCFEFFEHPLSATSSAFAHRFVSCVKCSSLTHIHCLPSPSPPPSAFLCPPCSKSNFTFFPIPDSNSSFVLDKKHALVLLCASKVASASMAKALGLARARADKTVRDAAVARKRAKEALEHCSVIDKVRRVEGSLEVSASRNLGIGMGMGSNNKGMYKKEDLNNGFIGGGRQGNIKVTSEVLPQNNGLSVPVNKNGANGNVNPVAVKDKTANREQDLERVRSFPGRIVDVSSTS